jgi:hypothetical protein
MQVPVGALLEAAPGMAQASLSTGSRSRLLHVSRGTRASVYIEHDWSSCEIIADEIRS